MSRHQRSEDAIPLEARVAYEVVKPARNGKGASVGEHGTIAAGEAMDGCDQATVTFRYTDGWKECLASANEAVYEKWPYVALIRRSP